MRAPGLVEFIKCTDRIARKFRPEEFRHALNRRIARHPVSWLAELARDVGLGIAGVQTVGDERSQARVDHLRVSVWLVTFLNQSWYLTQPRALRSTIPA